MSVVSNTVGVPYVCTVRVYLTVHTSTIHYCLRRTYVIVPAMVLKERAGCIALPTRALNQ